MKERKRGARRCPSRGGGKIRSRREALRPEEGRKKKDGDWDSARHDQRITLSALGNGKKTGPITATGEKKFDHLLGRGRGGRRVSQLGSHLKKSTVLLINLDAKKSYSPPRLEGKEESGQQRAGLTGQRSALVCGFNEKEA